MNRIVKVCAVTVIAALTGCQSLSSADETNEPVRTSADTLRVDRYYEMMMPGDTALRDVTDDGTNMYLDFREPLPADTKFFDPEGRELMTVSDGALVGVAGLHQGVLVKTNGKSSFVSVREGANREMAPMPANTPTIARMRESLIGQVAAAQAMKRALEALEAKEKAAQEAARRAATEKAAVDEAAAIEASKAEASARQAAGDGSQAISTAGTAVAGSVLRDVPAVRSTEAMMRVFFDFDEVRTKLGFMAEGVPQRAGVFITGHTDSVGPAQYNLQLGMRRAQFVADRLSDEGVRRTVMTVESRGEAEPLESNDTAEGRAKNRRVEVRLVP